MMKLFVALLPVAGALLLAALLVAFVCFRIVFYVSRKGEDHETISLPAGKAYLPYREELIAWTERKRSLPQQEFSISWQKSS